MTEQECIKKGLKAYGNNNMKKAKEFFTEATQINPASYVGYYYLGYTFDHEKDTLRAIQEYSKAIDIKPDYDDALFLRACAYENVERPIEAVADYKKILEIVPDDKFVQVSLDHVLKDIAFKEQAYKALTGESNE